MLRILIYKGWGMYDRDGLILWRQLTKYVSSQKYSISFVSPDQVKAGVLNHETSLFVIGGGFDLGLIKGQDGMKKITEYVNSGGCYLGICSGAYFACDYIEFDKSGPLEVIGERFLKFYPGHSYGPIYKPYDYKTKSGAVGSGISYLTEQSNRGNEIDSGQHVNMSQHKLTNGHTTEELTDSAAQLGDLFDKSQLSRCFKTYFNGGGLFVSKDDHLTVLAGKIITSVEHESTSDAKINGNKSVLKDNGTKNTVSNDDSTEINGFKSLNTETNYNPVTSVSSNHYAELGYEKVQVLARYSDLDMNPAAIVKCVVGKGTAVLSHVHFEYDADDINDGDVLVQEVVEELRDSDDNRKCLFLSILKELNISLEESQILQSNQA